MKLRVRINKQTRCVELEGAEPTLQELSDVIRETLLEAHGLSPQTLFSLSLNGAERLTDHDRTLASCAVVPGDLVCVILPEDAVPAVAAEAPPPADRTSCSSQSDSRSEDVSPAAAWEPMLCSEAAPGRTPLSLELLYHRAAACSATDALMVAAHLLMLETGFIPQGGERRPAEMPAGWRSADGVYRLQYLHPLCEGSVVTAVGVCMGPLLVINTTLKVADRVDTVRKLCLPACSYVSEACPGESAAAAFTDLNKLSRVFKDQLAYPLIAAARHAMALPVAFGLPALPPELLLRVLRLLNVRSVLRLATASRHFHTATSDTTLWRHLYCRDFVIRDSDRLRSRDTDWRALYKKAYKLRCESRRPPRPFFAPDVLPDDLPFVPVLPGIIGGEYDNRPALPRPLLPRPRYDPIGALIDPDRRPRHDLRRLGPAGGRPSDVRRGFI